MSAGQPLMWLVRSSRTWLASEGVIVGPCGRSACSELATPCSVDSPAVGPVGGLPTGAEAAESRRPVSPSPEPRSRPPLLTPSAVSECVGVGGPSASIPPTWFVSTASGEASVGEASTAVEGGPGAFEVVTMLHGGGTIDGGLLPSAGESSGGPEVVGVDGRCMGCEIKRGRAVASSTGPAALQSALAFWAWL